MQIFLHPLFCKIKVFIWEHFFPQTNMNIDMSVKGWYYISFRLQLMCCKRKTSTKEENLWTSEFWSQQHQNVTPHILPDELNRFTVSLQSLVSYKLYKNTDLKHNFTCDCYIITLCSNMRMICTNLGHCSHLQERKPQGGNTKKSQSTWNWQQRIYYFIYFIWLLTVSSVTCYTRCILTCFKRNQVRRVSRSPAPLQDKDGNMTCS